ncbi:hypothetical protein FHR87_000810 [Azomonas macrocytogenes]|uniref:Transposase n=1 Tax=Azomonas macrocytogenes TaxID=69962 RepID=A0A839SYL7_AZOMA|nr:hypothetical protein [Azomonas macrocytogenes]
MCVCSLDRFIAADDPGVQPAEQRHGRILRKTMKRDYIAHMPRSDRLTIAFGHYNEQHPHSALK